MLKIHAYLDNAASTCVRQEVLDVMVPLLQQHFGNPSSRHAAGTKARYVVESSRDTIAVAINCDPDELVFTSGGTEADHLALVGTSLLAPKDRRHIVVSSIEHHAVLHAAEQLEQSGFSVTLIEPDSEGIVQPADIAAALRPDTFLVSIMMVNNEIGTIQPLAEIGAILRPLNILFHSDAVQGFGKISVDVKQLNVDLLSLSAHKLHGPKGIGALFVRRGVPIKPLLPGGGQEHGLRSGTENVPAIAGFAKAAELAISTLEESSKRIIALRNRLETSILSQVSGSKLASTSDHRSPYITNILFPMLNSDYLIAKLDSAGICVTSGSACASHSLESSHVLRALGMSDDDARSAIRFSLSAHSTEAEINHTVQTIHAIVGQFSN